MMRGHGPARRKAEPTVALINVVFLMLVFFLVAGQISASFERDLRLVDAETRPAAAPDDALAVLADGRTLWRGAETTPEHFAAAQLGATGGELRLMPDRALPAGQLLEIAARLRAAGATQVRIVTLRGAG